MAWDKNELVVLGGILTSITILRITNSLAEPNFMLILTGMTTYLFGRILNHKEGKEKEGD